MQILLTHFVTCLQTKFLLPIMHLQKVFIFSQLVNRPSQLIRQYFTCQLAQVSLFANISSLQNFPTYGIQLSAPSLMERSQVANDLN